MLSLVPINGILGHAFDSVRNETYHFTECIGKGAHGSVYRALTGVGRKAILKVFTNGSKDDTDRSVALSNLIEREYSMNKYLQELMPNSSVDRGFFTFVETMFFHYAEIYSPRNRASYVGLHSGCFKFEKSNRTVPLDRFCDHVISCISDPRVLTAAVLHLSELICAAVAAIHKHGFFHCDIKLSNVLVSLTMSDDIDTVSARNIAHYLSDLSIKLIDFSLAQIPGSVSHSFCKKNQLSPDFLTGLDENNEYIYLASPAVTDPRSTFSAVSLTDESVSYLCKAPLMRGFHLRFTAQEAVALYPKFEIFSIACVVMSMFDPEAYEENFLVPPKIRITDTMSMTQASGIHKLLSEMTGPLNLRPEITWCSVRFGIMRDRVCNALRQSNERAAVPLVPSRAPPSPPCALRAKDRRFRARTHPINTK
jgi:serine/threonine protein kinase